MGRLYVLMGGDNTRKSVTIRALTGFTRCNPLEVRPVENGDSTTIYVIPSSPQEADDSFNRGILKISQEGHEWDVLLALHPDDKAPGFIQRIPGASRQEIHIVPLGSEGIPADLQQDISDLPSSHLNIYPGIPDSANIPANEIAHRIRGEWGWL